MNRKLLSLITIICIFTVSLLGQVAYASELNSANVAGQVTINATPTWLVSWSAVSGAVKYKISCRDITNSDTGPLLFSGRDVGGALQYTITSSKLIVDHEYRFFIAAYDKNGNSIGPGQYQYFTYTE